MNELLFLSFRLCYFLNSYKDYIRDTVANVVIFPSSPILRTLGIYAVRTSKSFASTSCHSSTYISPLKIATPVGVHGPVSSKIVFIYTARLTFSTLLLPVAATYIVP